MLVLSLHNTYITYHNGSQNNTYRSRALLARPTSSIGRLFLSVPGLTVAATYKRSPIYLIADNSDVVWRRTRHVPHSGILGDGGGGDR